MILKMACEIDGMRTRVRALALLGGVLVLTGGPFMATPGWALPALRGAIVADPELETEPAAEESGAINSPLPGAQAPEPPRTGSLVAVPRPVMRPRSLSPVRAAETALPPEMTSAAAPVRPIAKPVTRADAVLSDFGWPDSSAPDSSAPEAPLPAAPDATPRPAIKPGSAPAPASSVAIKDPVPAPAAETPAAPTPVPTTPTARREAQFAAGVAAYDAGDYAGAYELWKPLADSHDLAAQRNIAHLLRTGMGVEKDLGKARTYYERAAERGLVSAQVNLGLLYLNGEGVDADSRQAAEWFYKAARAGDRNAQFLIAQRLEQGDGVTQDFSAAQAYYAAAASAGHTEALEALARLGIEDEPADLGLTPPADTGAPPAPVAAPQARVAAASNSPRAGARSLYGGTGLEDR